MPSMACLILRAAARVSSSAALATYRFAAATRAAAAARSGSGGAAASDPLKHSSSVAAAGTAWSPASSGSFRAPVAAGSFRPPVAAGPPRSRLSHDSGFAKFVQLDRAKFEANEKDLESDDALWGLYERWCKFFNQERDHEEMARRFSYFKKTVLRVEENKKSDLPYRLGINKFADGKVIELYRESSTMNHVRRPRSASPIYGSEVGFAFNEDPAANKGPGQAGRRN